MRRGTLKRSEPAELYASLRASSSVSHTTVSPTAYCTALANFSGAATTSWMGLLVPPSVRTESGTGMARMVSSGMKVSGEYFFSLR